MNKFKVGEEVAWDSQAGGYSSLKLGEVIEVVPPGTDPPGIKGAGMRRDHESYVIKARVIDGSDAQRKRTKKYWPRVPGLRLATTWDRESAAQGTP